MRHLTQSALLLAFILLCCPTGAGATPVSLTVAFSPRHFTDGSFDGIVGGFEGPYTLMVKKVESGLHRFEDRTVLEFDVSGESESLTPIYLNFYLRSSPTEGTEDFLSPLSLYAFVGNGAVEFADFYRTDTFVTSFSGYGRSGPDPFFNYLAFAIDVTATYNQFISDGEPFLAFLLLADTNETRYDLNAGGHTLANYISLSEVPLEFPPPPVPAPDPGVSLLLLGIGLAGIAGFAGRK